MAVKPPPVSSMARDQVPSARNRKPPQGPLPIPIKTWNEADHPRDSDGKFTDGSGGGGQVSPDNMGGKPTQPQHIGGGGQPVKPRTTVVNLLNHDRATVSNEIKELYKSAANHGGEEKLIRYAYTTVAETDRIKSAVGIDTDGYHRAIERRYVRHIFLDHSDIREESKYNQTPITIDDIDLIPEIAANPDSVERGYIVRGNQRLIYSKEVAGFEYTYVEEVRKKYKQLAVITLWKKRKAGGQGGSSD